MSSTSSQRIKPSSEDLKRFIEEMKAAQSLEEMETSESSHTNMNFNPSLIAVAAFGLLNSLNMYLVNLKSWPTILSGILAFLESIILLEWFNLHGMKLTRKEQVFFDERNILETSAQLNYNLPPVLDDVTPGVLSEEKQSILAELFRNEKDEQMQKWYKMHYGNVYEHAMKAARQHEMMEDAVNKHEQSKK